MKTAFSPFCSTLNFFNGAASIFYASHVTPLHAHNTLQLVFDLKGTFALRTANTPWKKYSGVIIRENVVHQLDTNDSVQLIVYIDPSSIAAQKLRDNYLRDGDVCSLTIVFSPLEEILVHNNLINPESKSIQLLIELIFSRIDKLNDDTVSNERISKVLNLIRQTNLDELSIDYLASKVFISASRLRMQFKQAVGISLHNYIIRHKILAAIMRIINGASIQDAAYSSGFNDSSHLHKLMLKTFTINPSIFIKNNKTFSVVGNDDFFEFKTEIA